MNYFLYILDLQYNDYKYIQYCWLKLQFISTIIFLLNIIREIKTLKNTSNIIFKIVNF